MKKLNIHEEIKDFNGNAVAMIGQDTMTIRDFLMQQVGSYSSDTGKETLENYALGMKITACKEGELELEEAEFKQLKKVLERKPIKMGDIVMAPVLMEMERAEKE